MALSIGVKTGSEIDVGGEVLRVADASNPFGIDVVIGNRTLRLTELVQKIART